MPAVSVVLPVYNAAATVGAAVDSILRQTFSDLELIVVNDGSRDGSREVAAAARDPRVRVLDQENRGLVASLNRGIAAAGGAYIARLDADDVAMPERLRRQVDYLERHPRVAVVGSAARVVYADGKARVRRRPLDPAAVRRHIVRVCPFFHSAVLMRRPALEHVGLYDPACDGSRGLRVEDYDLWVRLLAAGYDLANLPDVLVEIHRRPGSILRDRSVARRLRQQVRSRVDTIRRLDLGPLAYANLGPVVVVSVLGGIGMKLDPLFNLLAGSRHRRSAASGEVRT